MAGSRAGADRCAADRGVPAAVPAVDAFARARVAAQRGPDRRRALHLRAGAGGRVGARVVWLDAQQLRQARALRAGFRAGDPHAGDPAANLAAAGAWRRAAESVAGLSGGERVPGVQRVL